MQQRWSLRPSLESTEPLLQSVVETAESDSFDDLSLKGVFISLSLLLHLKLVEIPGYISVYQIESLSKVLSKVPEFCKIQKDKSTLEHQEDARILLWQEQKRIQEAGLENEKLLIQKQKDKEFYEVAAQMKKSEDGRSEQDAARAKKYQIEEMKKKNEREENERRRQQEITEDLQRTRREQALKKLENLKILAIQDKKEWDRLNKQSSEVQKKAEEEDMKQRKMNQRHQKELIEQIKLREEINMKKKVELVEEGQRLKRENDIFIQKVKQKKKEILDEMRNNEIPEKYCADVARMRITIS